MTPIRLTVTAVALGAATFFVTTLILDGAPQRAIPAPTAADDRAAFVARVAAGLEDEPHVRGRSPAAEAQAEAPAPRASEADDIAADTRAVLAAVGRATVKATEPPAPPPAIDAAASRFRPPAEPASPTFALGSTEDWAAASAQGWVAASGSGPATLELRPMPRR